MNWQPMSLLGVGFAPPTFLLTIWVRKPLKSLLSLFNKDLRFLKGFTTLQGSLSIFARALRCRKAFSMSKGFFDVERVSQPYKAPFRFRKDSSIFAKVHWFCKVSSTLKAISILQGFFDIERHFHFSRFSSILKGFSLSSCSTPSAAEEPRRRASHLEELGQIKKAEPTNSHS